jgi:hypothetical protein
MSSGVVHQNIDVRKSKIIFWARRLWTHGTCFQIEGKNRSRRSVTILLNLVTLRVWGYGGGPTFHFVTIAPGSKQVNAIPPPSAGVCELRSL